MKKIIFALMAVLIIFATCCEKKETVSDNKETSVLQMNPAYSIEEVQNIINDLNLEAKQNPGWWQRLKAWVIAHAGTHLFENCRGNHACGPCAGICFKSGVIGGEITDDDSATEGEHIVGLGVFGIFLVENIETQEEAIMFIFSKNEVDIFTTENFLYIEDDIFADATINEALNKESILFEKGKYHVLYDETTNYYYSLVKTIIK